MFCPKCGNDSGEFKFCPYCGTKIPEEEVKTAVWSVGMACPHCGGTKLDGNNCAFCGAQLIADTSYKEYVDIPLGTYKGRLLGTLTLKENSVVMRYRFLMLYEQEVPYNQLQRVCFIRAYRNNPGYIGVDWVGRRSQPSQMHPKGNLHDTFAIPFTEEYNEDFYKVFCFLRTKAPENAQFSMYHSI